MAATEALSAEDMLSKPVEDIMNTKSSTGSTEITTSIFPLASSSSSSHLNGVSGGGGSKSETSQEADDGDVAWDADEVGSKDEGESSTKALREELARIKEERNSFEAQYRGLLGKLSQMRSTLGDRLRQDAEELDRREQQIEALQIKSQELQDTVETLKEELLTSHGDVERMTQELDSVRAAQVQSSQGESRNGEIKLRDLQELTERYRIDAESWESSCMEERTYREELALEIREIKRERDEAVLREQEEKRRAEREAQSAFDLQQVLEEFQASQDGEMQRAIGEYKLKNEEISRSLDDYQERAAKAEEQATEYKQGWEKCQLLEKEIKEKNMLIGKLRHEAVILNEHLTEALRRIRANTTDSSVDGKLITNLLLQFLNTPRNDTKRFEMLSLIGSVLNWTSEDREKAGLQRGSSNSSSNGSAVKSTNAKRETHSRSASGKATDESFSNLFVEFLLSEAEKAKSPAASPAPESPGSTKSIAATSPPPNVSRPSFNLGSLASLNRASSSGDIRSPSISGLTSPR